MPLFTITRGRRTILVALIQIALYSVVMGLACQITEELPTWYFVVLCLMVGLMGTQLTLAVVMDDPLVPRRVRYWQLFQLLPLLIIVSVISVFALTTDPAYLPYLWVYVPLVVWPMFVFLTILIGLMIHGIQLVHLRRLQRAND